MSKLLTGRRMLAITVLAVASVACAHGQSKAKNEVRIADPGCRALVVACKEIGHSQATAKWQSGRSHGDSLAQQRRLVDGNRQGLARLHRALAMPIHVPRLDWITSSSTFVLARSAANVLAAAESVSMADGKSSQAVATFLDGLRLSGVLRHNSFAMELMSASCQQIVTEPIARNLNRLSEPDCDVLLRAVRKQLRQTVAWDELAAGEDQEDHDLVVEIGHSMLGWIVEQAAKHPEYGVSVQDQRPALETLHQLITRSDALRGAAYRAFAAELKKPYWARKTVPYPPKDDPLTNVLVEVVGDMGNFDQVSQQITAREARLRLLGVHVAITAYRLDHHSLPDALATLDVPDLVTDPFSGKPFVYRHGGTGGYALYSVGSDMVDDGGKAAKVGEKGDLFVLRDGSR